MPKYSSSILDRAKRGAMVRWNELQTEIADLVRAFPDLRNAQTPSAIGRENGHTETLAATDGQPRGETRSRRMSPAARQAVSLRMKKYWAARRKEKGL